MPSGPRRLLIRSGKHLLRALSEFQGRHSLVPTTPFLPADTFNWEAELRNATPQIHAELMALLPQLDSIPAFHQISPDQARISQGDHWKTFILMVFGQGIAANQAQCPTTSALLSRLPGLQNAWFSILAPGYHIPPHRGPTRALVRAHLGLVIPTPPERCWIRVADECRSWAQGDCMLFDDTYEHEVCNDTDQYRIVLFMDFDRPMDRVGTVLNRLLIRMLKASAYVKDPLKNLARLAGAQRPR